jgi:hypothetical protein
VAVKELPPLQDPDSGEVIKRTIETWLPKKKIKAWSTRYPMMPYVTLHSRRLGSCLVARSSYKVKP